jgi:hypothetical protein
MKISIGRVNTYRSLLGRHWFAGLKFGLDEATNNERRVGRLFGRAAV